MTTPSTGVAALGATAQTAHFWIPMVRGYQWLASREMLACVFILVLTLGLRAALFPWLPIPQPMIHDEFSYLLAADTYAHGRLTNPPHPFWQHFETFHVLQQPTYASKYQPLQGLVLAFGQKFFGLPWIGVYLTTGLMCAAICWMLQGWIAPQWALLGALFFALRVGVLSYWMNSYFPGAVAGLGGALTLGALIRIWRRKQFGHSLTWALGLTMVALSRPFDAAVLASTTVGILLFWLVRKSHAPVKVLCLRVGLPAAALLGLCAVGIAYNDYRVTGRALTLPDQVYEARYTIVPMGIFSLFPLNPEPPFRHAVMREVARSSVTQWTYARKHPFVFLLIKLYLLDDFFFPFWPLLIPVLLWPYDLHTSEERATVFFLMAAVAMTAPLILSQPHYVAIFTGMFYLRLLHTLTRLRSWRPWDKPVGPALGIVLVGLLAGRLCINFFSLIYGNEGRDFSSQLLLSQGASFASARQTVIQELKKQPGRQLVFVRYTAEHSPHGEWVYNRADIDASAIVWAREMGPAQDRPFLEYFRDRRVWLLEPDRSPPKLSPYPSQVSQ